MNFPTLLYMLKKISAAKWLQDFYVLFFKCQVGIDSRTETQLKYVLYRCRSITVRSFLIEHFHLNTNQNVSMLYYIGLLLYIILLDFHTYTHTEICH